MRAFSERRTLAQIHARGFSLNDATSLAVVQIVGGLGYECLENFSPQEQEAGGSV